MGCGLIVTSSLIAVMVSCGILLPSSSTLLSDDELFCSTAFSRGCQVCKKHTRDHNDR